MITKMFMLLPVVLLLLSLSPTPIAAQAPMSCSYKPNNNITAPDMAAAKFAVSSYDCCNLCWNMPGCVAALYHNYLCHFKAVSEPIEQSMGGTTAIFTRPLPTPAPPTPIPTTLAPLPPPTTPNPHMTPTPYSPDNSVVIYRSVKCSFPSKCNVVAGQGSCDVKIYFSGVCYGRKSHTCTSTNNIVAAYPSENCQGKPFKSYGIFDICALEETGTYHSGYCDVTQPAVVGQVIVMSACGKSNCTTSSQGCQNTTVTSGQCNDGKMMYCWPNAAREDPHFGSAGYVTIATYPNNDCIGTPNITAVPIDVCYQDWLGHHYANYCN